MSYTIYSCAPRIGDSSTGNNSYFPVLTLNDGSLLNLYEALEYGFGNSATDFDSLDIYTNEKSAETLSNNNVTYTLNSTHNGRIYTIGFRIKEAYRDKIKFNVNTDIKGYFIANNSTNLNPPSTYKLLDYNRQDTDDYIQGVFLDEYTIIFPTLQTGYDNVNSSQIYLVFAELNNGWNYLRTISTTQYYIICATIGNSESQYAFYDKYYSLWEQCLEDLTEEQEVPEIEYLPITTTLENCDIKFIVNGSYVEQGEVEKGAILSIEVTANEGYYFEETPRYSYTDKNGNSRRVNFTQQSETLYTVTDFDTANVMNTLTVTATAVIKEEEPEPEPEPEYIVVTLDLSQSTIKAFSETGLELDVNKIVRNEIVTFEITANEDYYFATVPTLIYFNNVAYQVVQNFSVASSNPDNNYPTIYTLTFDTSLVNQHGTGVYDIVIHSSATVKHEENPDTGFSGNYGIVTYYNPTVENLRTIASDRQYVKESSYYVIIVDKGDYIAELRQVFMNVNVADEETCYLGGYNMGFSCPVLSSLLQNIEIGTFTIPEKFNNAYDYVNTTVRVYLPFYGFLDLDSNYIINQTIHIYYRVYVPTGDSVILIEQFNTDTHEYDIIYSVECNVAFKVPYLVQGEAYDTANLFTNHKLLYGFQPFVEITRYKNQNSLTAKSYNNEYIQIKDLQGYCSCETVFDNVKATKVEKDLIDETLRSGFII